MYSEAWAHDSSRVCVHVTDFANNARRSELLGIELLKARHDTRTRRDGDQLNLLAAHPTHRRET
jgi:hypothetical protein